HAVGQDVPPLTPPGRTPLMRPRPVPEDYRPPSPFRAPDWRSCLAARLMAGPLPPHLDRQVDALVRAAAAALAGEPADPALLAALDLWAGPPLAAAEVEGRAVGGQSDAQIAAATGLAA